MRITGWPSSILMCMPTEFKLGIIVLTTIYCNSDNSGTITYDEFKNVFSASVGPESIPFDFNWSVCHSAVKTPSLLIYPTVTGLNFIWEKGKTRTS